MRDLAAVAAATFLAERERWALWAPALIGVGIGLYFALDREPALWIGPAFLAGFLAATMLARRAPAASLFALGLAMLALGFSAAQFRTGQVAAPVLDRPYGPAMVAGRVISIEPFPNGARVMLDEISLRRRAPDRIPARVRIRLREGDRPALGARVEVYARLMPPGGPAEPGAYDFQRHAWFSGIGAVGWAYGRTKTIEDAAADSGIALWVEAVRARVAGRIRAAEPGPAGAVAAALVTGDRSAIPEDVMAAMRDSGLAHLLAISGLHMGLVAAILFFGLRALLACSERLALRHPIKKWAACAALLGGAGYLVLTGATIPTQRAFLMTGFVLLAVILDRTAISLRLVAWAAAAILLVTPESLLSASFQMSFAAVVALVAVYESGRPLGDWASSGPFRRITLYVAGVAVTTLVAGCATSVFAMYHFGRIAHFGIAANLLAVPVTAFWIMPWAVVGMALMPFGLESLALAPMGWGIDTVIAIARNVAGWPGAVGLVPAMPTAGLAAAAVGGLWLCLWRRRWRFIGIAGLLAGVATVALAPRPDILISADGRLMAVRAPDGTLALSTVQREKRTARIWLSRAGQRDTRDWRDGVEGLSCDDLACIFRANGRIVSLVTDPRALSEDCRRANVVVSSVPVRGRCPSAELVVDWFDLWRHGGHALWLTRDALGLATVAELRGERPWTPKRPARRTKYPSAGRL